MAEVKVSALTALTGANVDNGDELYIVDTGSPNVSKKITADELAQMPQLSSRYKPIANDSVLIPASAFVSALGSPSLTTFDASQYWTGWRLDQSSNEGVGGIVGVPPWWSTFHIDVHTVNDGAGAGDVVLSMRRVFAGDTDSTSAATTTNITFTAAAENVVKTVRMVTSASNTTGKPLYLAVLRTANSASDTLGNDIAVTAIELVFAS